MADITDLIFLAGGKGGEVAALIPDVVVDTKHTLSNNISQYPIEKREDGAYNVKRNNNKILVTGMFVEPYVDFTNDDVSDRVNLNSLAGSTPSVLPEAITSKSTRRQEAFNRLEKAVDNKEFLDIVTGLKTYEDCLIESINIDDNYSTQTTLQFSMVLIQPRFSTIAETLEVEIIEGKSDSASSRKTLRQETVEVPAGTFDSWWSRISAQLSNAGENLTTGGTP